MDSCNKIDLEALKTRTGFSTYNQIQITDFPPEGGALGELTVNPNSLNPRGIVHGGCLAALADTVAGVATVRDTGHTCVTMNYCFNFLRPATATNRKILCRAEPEKLGKTVCIYRVILTDDEDRAVATGSFTFFLLGPLNT